MQKFSINRRDYLLAAGVAIHSLVAGSVVVVQASDDLVQPDVPDAEAFMARAMEMRQRAVSAGDRPYGAVIVKDSRIVSQAGSQVVTHRDPTAHAEMEAIRDAARRLGGRLTGCTLYSSSRACPMCEAAAYWAGVDRMIHGQSLIDAGSPALC